VQRCAAAGLAVHHKGAKPLLAHPGMAEHILAIVKETGIDQRGSLCRQPRIIPFDA
jgi:hypothetical protein